MINHKIAVHQLIDVCTSAVGRPPNSVGRPTNLYLLKTSPKYSNDFYYIFRGLLFRWSTKNMTKFQASQRKL